MKMAPNKTSRGFTIYHFTDYNDNPCSLQESSLATDDGIWLGVDDPKPKVLMPKEGWVDYPIPPNVSFATRMHLTKEQAKALVEKLQTFIDTGHL